MCYFYKREKKKCLYIYLFVSNITNIFTKIKYYQPIRNKNCLWWPCLLMDRDEMSILYRGPSIDASYHISVHLAVRFQRRFLEIDQSETKIDCGGHVC